MKAEDNRIMNIIYSPIMYTHPERLSEIHHSREILNDVLLNHWIFSQYHLDDLPSFWQPGDSVSELIIIHWKIIPTIANLIGGYLLQDRLIIERMTLINDPTLLAFISLPLRHTVIISQSYQHADFSAYGAAFLMYMIKNLPSAFHQRFRLCFPKQSSLPQLGMTKTPDHINLLKMAINYANDFQK